jgi:hypothetical protein
VPASFSQSARKHFRFAGDSEFILNVLLKDPNNESQYAISRLELRGGCWSLLFLYGGARRAERNFVSRVRLISAKVCHLKDLQGWI